MGSSDTAHVCPTVFLFLNPGSQAAGRVRGPGLGRGESEVSCRSWAALGFVLCGARLAALARESTLPAPTR